MKFKSQRHLILSLKKKSGVQLSDSEIKELLGIEGVEEKKPEDEPKKEEPKKEEPKKEEMKTEDKPKEEVKPKEEEKKDGHEAGSAPTIEGLAASIAQLTENVNMIMEAMAAMMEGAAPAPAEEAKTEEETEEEKKPEEDADMTEDEMEEELKKTISELEGLA